MKRLGRDGGASLFELIVVGIVVAILAGVLLRRIDLYREQAERAAVERTVGVLRAALEMRIAQRKLEGSDDGIASLEEQNPMLFLPQQPSNYAGEFFSPSPDLVPVGHWYFDRKRHYLVYLLNFSEKFPDGTPKSLKYKVKLVDLKKRYDGSTEAPAQRGIALIQVDG